jgi:TPR repeat protein
MLYAVMVFIGISNIFFTLTYAADARNVGSIAERAKSGDPEAQINLMFRHGLGIGVKQDEAKAIECAKELSNDDNTLKDLIPEIFTKVNNQYNQCKKNKIITYSNLGRRFEVNSKTIPLASHIAFILYLESAKLGDANCQCAVGTKYEHGNGTLSNPAEAFDWYLKAANQQHAVASYNLGYCFYEGLGVKKNKKDARRWWKKSSDAGHPEAHYSLAQMYEKGDSVAKDENKAFKLYILAATGKELPAYRRLYEVFAEGQLGQNVNEEKAFSYKKLVAEAGDASCQHGVGLAYIEGTGTQIDKVKGFQYLLLSAKQNFAPAQYEVGRCYKNATGVEQSISEMKNWYDKAAAQKFPQAMAAVANYNIARITTRLDPEPMKLYDEAENLLREAYELATDLKVRASIEELYNTFKKSIAQFKNVAISEIPELVQKMNWSATETVLIVDLSSGQDT